MAKRFSKSPIQAGEIAPYLANPWAQYASFPFKESGKDIEIVQVSDEFLQNRGGLQALDSYIKLLYDSTVLANMIKLCQEIISRELIIEPASEKPKDVKVCEEVKRQLSNLNMDEVYRKSCEAYIYGHSPQEVMWRKSRRGVIEAYDIRPRDPRRFLFTQDSSAKGGFSMRLLTKEDPYKGVPIPNRKIISFRYWVQNNGDPYGSGLGKALYFLVKVKRRVLESEVLYTDRYATPTAIATAPMSATREEVDSIYQLITNLSQETGAVLPEGWSFDFVNPTGSQEAFQNLREYLHKEISLLIAGEDEAGSSEAGSRASSEVAQDVRTRKALELSELISTNLEQTLVKWIVELNFGMGVAIPKLRRDFPLEEPSTLTAQDLGTLMEKLNVKPMLSWVESHFKVKLQRDENGEIYVEDVEANKANSFFSP
jgi:phage gp29-like protein